MVVIRRQPSFARLSFSDIRDHKSRSAEEWHPEVESKSVGGEYLDAAIRAGTRQATYRLKQARTLLLNGDHAKARQFYDEALAICRANSDLLGQGTALAGKGSSELLAGHSHEARPAYLEAIALFRQNNNHTEEGYALVALAEVERRIGNKEDQKQRFDEARSAYRKAAAVSQQRRNEARQAEALMALGNLEKGLGDRDAARQAFRDAAQVYGALGLIPHREMALAALGEL